MPLVTQVELIKKAIAEKVVSFPTDTVPALAVLPEKADLIFEIKQRSTDKPLILMAATIDEIWTYVLGTAEERTIWQAIAEVARLSKIQRLPSCLRSATSDGFFIIISIVSANAVAFCGTIQPAPL